MADAATSTQADFYVSPDGDDRSSGQLDAPFASLDRAREAVRQLRRDVPDRQKPIRVLLRAGTHRLNETVVFEPADSGSAECPIVYAAYPGETPVLSGGVAITGWQHDRDNRWVAHVPAVAATRWVFRQLFVGGQRRPRAALPKQGYYTIAEEVEPAPDATGFDRFGFHPGDIARWHHVEDVEIVYFHYWRAPRFRVKAIDEDKHHVILTAPTPSRRSSACLAEGERYRVENVYETLELPGEWYLDRQTGVVTYMAAEGEDPNESGAVAPRVDTLVRLAGDVDHDRYVEHLSFVGLTFADAAWDLPREGLQFSQSEVGLGAVIEAEGTRFCGIVDSTVTRSGLYGIALGRGCQDNRICANLLHDLGGGGIKIGETELRSKADEIAAFNRIDDNHIHHVGLVHHAAVGILLGQTFDNSVCGNHIHHLTYSGISVGWTWGYGPTNTRQIRIERNHIHHIGQGVLADLGGIYTLGAQPKTVIRHNHIHDVASYGEPGTMRCGWGIYLDEGSSYMLVENNLVYRTTDGGFHLHYGRENVVCNNLLAFSGVSQVNVTRRERHQSISFEHNVVVYDSGDLLGFKGTLWADDRIVCGSNLYWRTDGQPVEIFGETLAERQARGLDPGSIVADPLFDAAERDGFTLAPNSPAKRVGFEPFDVPGTTTSPCGDKTH